MCIVFWIFYCVVITCRGETLVDLQQKLIWLIIMIVYIVIDILKKKCKLSTEEEILKFFCISNCDVYNSWLIWQTYFLRWKLIENHLMRYYAPYYRGSKCVQKIQLNECGFNTFVLVGNCIFKVNSRNTRKRCEICSKLTIKTPLNIFHTLF